MHKSDILSHISKRSLYNNLAQHLSPYDAITLIGKCSITHDTLDVLETSITLFSPSFPL